MARYIKVNPLVAKYLNLQNDRNTTQDGNYILWQADMLAFGPLYRLSETLAAIGGIALMPHEAREEQDGVQLRPLPEATDPRFIIPVPVTPEPVEETTDEGETTTEISDATPEPTGDETAEATDTDDNTTPNNETV